MTPDLSCPSNCPLGQTVAVHAREIEDLKDAHQRIEEKLDQLMWRIMAALGTSVLALFGIMIGLLKK
jgi:tetrahydromethanopterin S-methyltransferase subunit G